jgi:hypothetical protein
LQLFVVFPAWRGYKIQKARTSLAKCFHVLNAGPFQTGIIANGDYLHDNFHTVVYKTLMNDELKILSTERIVHTEAQEIKRLKFRNEIDALDDDLKETVNNAVFAMGTLIFLQNLIQFPTLFFKCALAKELYDKQAREERMMRSGEYAVVDQRHKRYDGPCPA